MLHSIITGAITVFTDIPNPTPVMPPGFGNVVLLMNWVMWIGIAILIIAIIAAWVWFAAAKRSGEGNESAVWVGRVLIAAIGVSAAATIVGTVGSFA